MQNTTFQHHLTVLEQLNNKYALTSDEMFEVAHIDFTMFDPYREAFNKIKVEVTDSNKQVTKELHILKIDARTYQHAESQAKEVMFGLI